MASGAIDQLDLLLRDGSLRLLELGSGDSSEWYAQRAKELVTVEPDPLWAAHVANRLAGYSHVSLKRLSVAEALTELCNEDAFDLVVVDHKDEPELTRADTIARLLGAPWTPRVIVLDDSDRSAYSNVEAMLAGWHRSVHLGFRSYPLRLTETTVWLQSVL